MGFSVARLVKGHVVLLEPLNRFLNNLLVVIQIAYLILGILLLNITIVADDGNQELISALVSQLLVAIAKQSGSKVFGEQVLLPKQ